MIVESEKARAGDALPSTTLRAPLPGRSDFIFRTTTSLRSFATHGRGNGEPFAEISSLISSRDAKSFDGFRNRHPPKLPLYVAVLHGSAGQKLFPVQCQAIRPRALSSRVHEEPVRSRSRFQAWRFLKIRSRPCWRLSRASFHKLEAAAKRRMARTVPCHSRIQPASMCHVTPWIGAPSCSFVAIVTAGKAITFGKLEKTL